MFWNPLFAVQLNLTQSICALDTAPPMTKCKIQNRVSSPFTENFVVPLGSMSPRRNISLSIICRLSLTICICLGIFLDSTIVASIYASSNLSLKYLQCTQVNVASGSISSSGNMGFSWCAAHCIFEGIEHFLGDLYKFHLKPEHKLSQHAPRKVPIHLGAAFKEEIKSLVKLGILEEVKEHTDWVNSYMIVEKDTGSHHSPNHTIKKKLSICLDPRDLNEALEREPYHTRSVDEITAKLQGMTVFTIVDFKKGYRMVVLHPDSRKLTCMALPFGRFQWT